MKYDWEYIDSLIPGKEKIDFKASIINFVLFWKSLMFHQVFLSPQVKRFAIITYRHAIYELPNELPNYSRKVSKPHGMIA